jgi:RAP domain/FAST kinase-like protein, subdomain 1
VWHKLGKAVQKSSKFQRGNFWIDHTAALQMLIDQSIQSADQLDGRSTATVMHSLVKILHLTNTKSLGAEVETLWNVLLTRTRLLLKQSNSFKAQEISNLIWAFGKADGIAVDGRLLDDIASRAVVCIDKFAPQGLANASWGFATLNHPAPLLFDAIAGTARIGEFNAQDLAITAWAFATLKHEAPSLFDAIARAASVCIGDFTPQILSNTVWSFAKLNHKAPALLDAIARAALVRINEFNSQNLSITAWSFAKLNHKAPALFIAIAIFAHGRINEFKPQELANTAWSFAALNHKAPALLDAIANATQVRIDEFNPQNLASTAWAYAKMNHDAPPLFDAIASASYERIHDFSPRNLSNTVWAFAMLNHEAPSLLDAIARAVLVRIDNFSPQGLSNTAWAYATLNHARPSLFEAIAHVAKGCIHDFNPQELSNVVWSFAVFDIEPSSFTHLGSPFAQTLQPMDPSIFSIEELHQLHQVILWCIEQTEACWYPDELSQQCRQVFVSAEAAPSPLQNDVVVALETLQDVSLVEEEVLTTNSGYSIDAVVTFRGERIGVEVNRPFHFVGQSQSPNGATILNHRQLRALEGWKLVTIPFWEWNEIDKGSNKERREKKQRYLQKLLEEAIVK